MKERKKSAVITGVFFLFAAFALYESFLLKKSTETCGPALVPLLSSLIIMLLSGLELISAFFADKNASGENDTNSETGTGLSLSRMTVCMILIIIYCFLFINGISFWIISPVFLILLLRFFNKGKLLIDLLITAGFTGSAYLLFVIVFGAYIP